MEYPRADTHYPRSTGEFLAWFRTDEACLDYLKWLRWPGGFACPHCGHAGGWQLADDRIECRGCGRRTSVTAGTIFDKTRTPLTVWFHACWLFATAKDGISAQHLQRALEIGSYHTAWAMLHRLRAALVRPGRDRLAGTVEVDETFIGGEEHGLRGGRQAGKKVLTGIAVEIGGPKGIGRCRMAVLADASGAALGPFVSGNVEPGTPRHHRRLGRLQRRGRPGLHPRTPQPEGRGPPRRGPRRPAARRPPGRLLVQTMAPGNTSGVSGPGAPARLPQRVHLPVQPPPLAQPRNGVLPRAGTRSRARPGPLFRHPRRHQATEQATATTWHRSPAQPGTP